MIKKCVNAHKDEITFCFFMGEKRITAMRCEMKVIEKIPFPSPNPKIKMYLVTYLSDHLKVKGLLAEPMDDKKYDGFLYLRGGIKSVGMVRPARIGQFASEGFIVFAPFYRGNRGGEGYEDFAGEDRKDGYAGFDILNQNPRVLKNRIHIFGFSRGGIMALHTAINRKEALSIVSWGGVSDMALTYLERKDLRRMMKRVIGGTPSKYPERYRERTPLYHLEDVSQPVLIIHGEKDQNVSFEHAKRLEKRLKLLRKSVETWYFPNYTHYFPPAINRQIVADLCLWMKKQVVT
jgi:dipeptidyl aminopeptidase/acylaminoacyl peptidase